jgi:hypothetical protein
MPQLVVVVPLKEGAYEEAKGLLSGGPPLALEDSPFVRHEVHLTRNEVVFVFTSPEGVPATLNVRADEPSFWRAAAKWRPLLDGKPRRAETAYTWEREAG